MSTITGHLGRHSRRIQYEEGDDDEEEEEEFAEEMKSTLTFDEQSATFFILPTFCQSCLPLSLSIFEEVGGGGEVQVI